jgi:hypothetical protein
MPRAGERPNHRNPVRRAHQPRPEPSGIRTARKRRLECRSTSDSDETGGELAASPYYGFLGDYAQQVVAGAAKDVDTVKRYVAAFEAAGADEVIGFPVSAQVEQADRFAEATLG